MTDTDDFIVVGGGASGCAVSSKLISKKSDTQVINIKNKNELKIYIKKNLFRDEVVICMGAGNISNWIREISIEL